MNGKIIERAGRILFGEHWKAPFGDQFGLSRKTLNRILAGNATAYPDLMAEVETALHDHGHKLDELLEAFV